VPRNTSRTKFSTEGWCLCVSYRHMLGRTEEDEAPSHEDERDFLHRLLTGGVAVPFEVSFEVLAPHLYRAAQPHARDVPAAQAPVDPALAHP
jgi:hypothetical protein